MSVRNASAIVVFVDADNTLWDTDRVFAEAQTGLLDDAERLLDAKADTEHRLAFVRLIDQEIAARHHAGLRYPPTLLATAVAAAILGVPPKVAARSARLGGNPASLGEKHLAEIERRYIDALNCRPVLRLGVLEGIKSLEHLGCELLIVSESARAKVEATADALGLGGHFLRVVEGRKRPELYVRVMRLLGSPERAYMVGDQLDRDIAPAQQAGLTTIYFPGGFTPVWMPDEAQVRPDYRIDDFRDIAGIIGGERPILEQVGQQRGG